MGAQIITGEAHRMMRVSDCVNRSSILWFAARRKGIARSAALHLDCARSPQRGRVWIHAGQLFACRLNGVRAIRCPWVLPLIPRPRSVSPNRRVCRGNRGRTRVARSCGPERHVAFRFLCRSCFGKRAAQCRCAMPTDLDGSASQRRGFRPRRSLC